MWEVLKQLSQDVLGKNISLEEIEDMNIMGVDDYFQQLLELVPEESHSMIISLFYSLPVEQRIEWLCEQGYLDASNYINGLVVVY